MKIVIKHILLLIVLSFYSRILSAQQTVSEQYAKFINIEDINAHISTLTSPGFEGREAGKRGGRKTEAFIKNTFEKIGLTPIIDSATNKTYFQKVPLLGGSHSYNVLGWVKGSVFPDEVLIITAHYDHLGTKGGDYFPGADDNASGISALLEISQAFVQAEKDGVLPKRSLLFIALTAEEKGLLGSQYYVEKNPLFPLNQTVVNLNMDMIGHLDNLHPTDPDFVSIVGSDWQSTDLHEIHEKANKDFVGLALDYTFNAINHPEMFFYRSDQYNFARHGIPVIFYTSGDHKDYHKRSDTIEKIEFSRIQKVAQLVFYTAWEIANRENRIVVDKKINN